MHHAAYARNIDTTRPSTSTRMCVRPGGVDLDLLYLAPRPPGTRSGSARAAPGVSPTTCGPGRRAAHALPHRPPHRIHNATAYPLGGHRQKKEQGKRRVRAGRAWPTRHTAADARDVGGAAAALSTNAPASLPSVAKSSTSSGGANDWSPSGGAQTNDSASFTHLRIAHWPRRSAWRGTSTCARRAHGGRARGTRQFCAR